MDKGTNTILQADLAALIAEHGIEAVEKAVCTVIARFFEEELKMIRRI